MPAIHVRLAIAGALALSALATPAASQSIHGQLVEEESGQPVAGAYVVLSDLGGTQHDAALTDADGRFIVAAPAPGAYELGVDRIGFMSARTDPIELAEGQILRYRLVTVVEPVLLGDIDVAVESECRVRPEEGRAVAEVWEEARKALNAAAFTQRMGLLDFSVVATERTLDPYTLAVRSERSRTRTGTSRGSPYVALRPEVLARQGYARFEGEEQTYWAPDPVTLLSDTFLDGHCFRLAEPPSDLPAEWIGLAFEPVADRRLPDIEGTLWIDRETALLQRLDYDYTNLPRSHAGRAGGRVAFDRLPSGEWVLPRWRIRMPVVRLPRADTYAHLTMDPNARVTTLVAIKEDSGEVMRVTPARGGDGAVWRVWAEPIPTAAAFAAVEAEARRRRDRARPTAARRDSLTAGPIADSRIEVVRQDAAGIAGTVVNAASGEPITGAQVALPDAGTGTTTGADGRFQLADPGAGSHVVTIHHLGYRTGRTTVETGPDRGARVEARLAPAPIAADAIEATLVGEGELARRAFGHARWSLTADDIPDHTVQGLPELLSTRFAGVTHRGRSRQSGCPVVELRDGVVSLVVLDGQPFYDTCILETVLATDVERIEVIPGSSASLEFGRLAGRGVIVITTRHGP